MAQANLRKEWVAQATISFADDEELMVLIAGHTQTSSVNGAIGTTESTEREGSVMR